MKIIRRFILYSFFVPFLAFSNGGDGIGSGGDRVSMSFVSTAWELYRSMKSSSLPQPNKFDPEAFKVAIELTEVSSKTSLFLGDREVDAINYPDTKKIHVNRGLWDSTGYSLHHIGLVLHEYLGIMRLDDRDYSLSSSIIKPLKIWLQDNSYDKKVLECWVTHIIGAKGKMIVEGSSPFLMNSQDEWSAGLQLKDKKGRTYLINQTQNLVSIWGTYKDKFLMQAKSPISDFWNFGFKDSSDRFEISCHNVRRK